MGSVDTKRQRLYIAGAPGGGSTSPPVHNYIAKQLNKPWHLEFYEFTTIQEVVDAFRAPNFAGGIVTMPWKTAIIPYLDETDSMIEIMGACNIVSVTPNGGLSGTNVDWVGIKIPLLKARPQKDETVGMIYGAGGASRAALYTFVVELGLTTVYILNRDGEEVGAFLRDASHYQNTLKPEIIHIKTIEQAKALAVPSYVVSTIPDFPARTAGEIEARQIFTHFMYKGQGSDGVMLDMCYHPRMTTNLEIAKGFGWIVVEGIQVSGYQYKAQWKRWTGLEISDEVEREAFAQLEALASADKTITI